jgi:tetratricopeptide (TPR) repeat protein
MPQATCFIELLPRFRGVARKLAQESPLCERVIGRLDGSTQIGQILGEAAGDPVAAATLWTLTHCGLVRLLDQRASRLVASELEFEVVVDDAQGSSAKVRNQKRSAGTGGEDKATAKGDAMREEIEALLEQLGDLDHYGALGLEANANAVEIKKAYFKAAKRYHPDALARVGVGDLRDEAARVFARMAEAFETLSDPNKKAAYDSGAGDAPEIDMARLAQAEKSYRKGEILLKMGNFLGALEYLASAVEFWPEEPAYQAALGWSLYRQPQPDPERAREHLATAHQQAPEDAETLYRLGVVLRASGETEGGDQCIARARALDPTVDG